MKIFFKIMPVFLFIYFSTVCYLHAGEHLSTLPLIDVNNNKIYVNRKEFFIKGAAYGLNYPMTMHYSQIPEEIFEKDFQMMREAGINTVRTYRPLPDFILDVAEKYDIMIIENVVYPGDWTDFNSPAELERLKNIAVRNVIKHKARKCILAWHIWNDAPFTFGQQGGNVIRRFGEEKVNRFFEEIYKAVKEVDPRHPVTGSNLTYYDESIRLGAGFLDLLSYNVYLGITDWLNGGFSSEKAIEQVKKFKEVSILYNKPVIIGETGYSSYLKATSQKEALKGQVNAVSGELAGIIIFEWADEWNKAGNPSRLDNHIEENWGIVDGQRNPKEGYNKLKEMWGTLKGKALRQTGAILKKGPGVD